LPVTLTLASPPDDLLVSFNSLHLEKVVPAQESNMRLTQRLFKEVMDKLVSIDDHVDEMYRGTRRHVKELRDIVRCKLDLHTTETYATLGFPVSYTKDLIDFLKGNKRDELMKVIISKELKRAVSMDELDASTGRRAKKKKSVSHVGTRVLNALFTPTFIATHNCFTSAK
jgi:hypothetical protein